MSLLPEFPNLTSLAGALRLLARPKTRLSGAVSAGECRTVLLEGIRSGSIRTINIAIDATVQREPNKLSCSFQMVGASDLPPHQWKAKISWPNSWLYANSPPEIAGELCIIRGYEIRIEVEDVLRFRQQGEVPHIASPLPNKGRPFALKVEDVVVLIPKIAEDAPYIESLPELVRSVKHRSGTKACRATVRKRVREALAILHAQGHPCVRNFCLIP